MTRTPLSHFVTTSRIVPILDDIFVTESGLQYQDIHVTTNDIQPCSYIGTTARENARQQKIAEMKAQMVQLEPQLLDKSQTISHANTTIQQLTNNLPNHKKLNHFHTQLTTATENRSKLQARIEEQTQQLRQMRSQNTQYHSIFSEKSFEQIEQDIRAYHENQLAEQKYATMKDSMQVQLARVDDLTQSTQELQTTIDSLKGTEAELQKELDVLLHDDKYQQLKDQLAQLKAKQSLLADKTNQLHAENGALSATITNQKDVVANNLHQYTRIQELYRTIQATADRIIPTLDTQNEYPKYRNMPECTYLSFKDTFVEYPRFDTSDSLARDVNDLLRNLYTTSVTVDSETKSIVDYTNELHQSIETQDSHCAKLFELTQIILKDKLFAIVEDTHESVKADLENLKATTSVKNKSMLKLFADYQIEPNKVRRLNMFHDSDLQEYYLGELNKEIEQMIEENDTTSGIDLDTITQIIAKRFDPISWYRIDFSYMNNDDTEPKPLNKSAIGQFSTGERVRTYYTPMLGLLDIIKQQTKADAPHLLTIDEAFASLDNDQTIFILERIHDVSDLFIATVPSGGGLPMAPNTTRIDTIHLRKQNINGQTITQSDKLIMTEEYLDEM